MTTSADAREAAWWRVHDLLERRPGWHVTAVDARNLGRRARHEALEGLGETELEALADLARRLDAP